MIAIDNYLKTPTTCQYLLTIKDVPSLKENRDKIEQYEKRVIVGDTSNLLFVDNFEGLVLKNRVMGEVLVKPNNQGVRITVPAGMKWHDLVKYTVTQGWWGIENLALIPGLVGSAPIQNIGAYGVELSDCKPIVYGFHLNTMQQAVFTTEECQFAYRESIFKQSLLDDFFIYAVSLQLSTVYQAKLDYTGLSELSKGKKPTQTQIMSKVCDIRQHKLPDPNKIPNLGSFFKNPVMSKLFYNDLLAQYPQLTSVANYENTEKASIKLSAAALIEQSGLKGYQHVAGAGVSNQHALVLINPKHKTGRAILALSTYVQQQVKQHFAIDLQPEIRIIANKL